MIGRGSSSPMSTMLCAHSPGAGEPLFLVAKSGVHLVGIDLCSLADLVQGGRVEAVSSVLGSCGIEDALAGTPGMREFGEIPQAVQYGFGGPPEIVLSLLHN